MSTNSPETSGNNDAVEEVKFNPNYDHLRADFDALEALSGDGSWQVECYLRELDRCIWNGEIHIEELREWFASGKPMPDNERDYWLKISGKFGIHIVDDEHDDARAILTVHHQSVPDLADHVWSRQATFDEIDAVLRGLLDDLFYG